MFERIFGAIVEAKIHAFFSEAGLLALAIVCAVAAIILLSIDPAGVEQWPIVGKLIVGAKRTIAYVLFGLAIGLACLFIGSRSGGALEREVCRAKLEAIAAANQHAIDDAKETERKRTAAETATINEQIDQLAQAATDAAAENADLRKALAIMAAKDPHAAAAPLPPMILQAIKGGRAK